MRAPKVIGSLRPFNQRRCFVCELAPRNRAMTEYVTQALAEFGSQLDDSLVRCLAETTSVTSVLYDRNRRVCRPNNVIVVLINGSIEVSIHLERWKYTSADVDQLR